MLADIVLNKNLIELTSVWFPSKDNFNFEVGNYKMYYDRKSTPRDTLEGGDGIEWSPRGSRFPKKGALVSELSIVQKHEDYNICTTLAFRLRNQKLLSVQNSRFDKKSNEWATLSRVEMYTKVSDTYHPICIEQNTHSKESISRKKYYCKGIEKNHFYDKSKVYYTPINEQDLMKNAIEIIGLIDKDNRKVSKDIDKLEYMRESSAMKLQYEVTDLLRKNILDGKNAHIHHHLHM